MGGANFFAATVRMTISVAIAVLVSGRSGGKRGGLVETTDVFRLVCSGKESDRPGGQWGCVARPFPISGYSCAGKLRKFRNGKIKKEIQLKTKPPGFANFQSGNLAFGKRC